MRVSLQPGAEPDRDVTEAVANIRRCVHCGFCLPTCPTYLLLNDERDSPRGRIYLIKDMLESGRPPSKALVTHIDRCLSCLACETACPSNVDYRRLVDQARARIEASRVRPLQERLLRYALPPVLTSPRIFRAAIALASAARPVRPLLPRRLRAMLGLAPQTARRRAAENAPGVFPAKGTRRMRVGLLAGCVQPVLRPQINAAAVRLLTRLGAEVVVVPGVGCCGALTHHLGQTRRAQAAASAAVLAWDRERRTGGLDAIVATASGCGSVIKDYAHVLSADAGLVVTAREIAGLARDIVEVVAALGRPRPVRQSSLRVAYQAACSLHHGQQIKKLPVELLTEAGYQVLEPAEPHICCGSAGTYNILQPEIASRLRERKLANLRELRPDVVASGNVGCLVHLASGDVATSHTVELLDWAYGGPPPASLASPGAD